MVRCPASRRDFFARRCRILFRFVGHIKVLHTACHPLAHFATVSSGFDLQHSVRLTHCFDLYNPPHRIHMSVARLVHDEEQTVLW